MNFTSLNPQLQELLLYSFETKVKITLFVGFLLISLFYVFYLSKQNKPTNSLLISILRVTNYYLCYLYMWLFWLIFPFYISPKVNIESILIALVGIYSILLIIFFILFLAGGFKILKSSLIEIGLLDEPEMNDDSFVSRLFYGK